MGFLLDKAPIHGNKTKRIQAFFFMASLYHFRTGTRGWMLWGQQQILWFHKSRKFPSKWAVVTAAYHRRLCPIDL